MRLMKRKLPRLCTDRLQVRLLEPHEADLMARFRIENRDHLERWEPRRGPEFFTEGFWEIHLRSTLRDFREGASASFVLLSPNEDEVLGVCNYTNIV
ncbi:MAG: 30S ribosomal protein S5 alanine N-acetyltransferase, partial [Proteobacteria bacterium]|nr:30S ribosomal protein S5 alanine N-acetyltransferase [Pseudomonadota bacterium]